MEKRINREIKELSKIYKYIDKSYDESIPTKKIVLEFDIYKFVVNKFYPFKPPTLYINNIDYQTMIFTNDDLFITDRLKKQKIRCLCCSTLLCTNNWSPAKKLIHIINEYKINKRIMKQIRDEKYVYYVTKDRLPQEIIDIIINYIYS